MNTDYIEINTQSSIRLELDKIIYFDPYKIDIDRNDADIIFITHDHYDHMDIDSINKIKNDNTIVVAPKTMEDTISRIDFKNYIYLKPFDEREVLGIDIKTIPAYNISKPFHPKENNWLSYIIKYNNAIYYIAGDTDKTIEAENVKCDIAFVPIGGHFTMDPIEASDLIRIINPKIVIPTHYGSIVGNKDDGLKLKDYLSDTDIEVIEKL